jgi:stearoyl-CoA desaturase (delta-9 desaturase)
VSTDVINIHDRQKLNWPTTLILVLLHIGAVAALFMFNWRAFAVAAFLLWGATGLGISMGYHRLHTHRSYKVPLGWSISSRYAEL